MRNTYLGYALGGRVAHGTAHEARRQSYAERTWSRDPLVRLRESFPEAPITFLQIPEKLEVACGAYYVDTESAIRAAGFAYASLLDTCDLQLDDFHSVDGHPHQAGYAKLANCVAEALGVGPSGGCALEGAVRPSPSSNAPWRRDRSRATT